jgi:hypothetical protein
MKNYFVCVAAIFIAGCNSGDQIEKCVQAALTANGPYKSAQDKAADEFTARRMCLEAASGNKN